MQKITLLVLILFVLVVSGAFLFGIQKTATESAQNINNSAVVNNNASNSDGTSVITKNIFTKDGSTPVKDNGVNTKAHLGADIPIKIIPPQINLSTIKIRVNETTGSGILPSEVLKHNRISDCYLAINGNVYDVTSYIPYHPAGAEIIRQYCGHEVTNIFAQIHSNRAWDLLARYKIGKLASLKPRVNMQAILLKTLKNALQKANPNIFILNITPNTSGYLAKVVAGGKMFELHFDKTGKLISQEDSKIELDWKFWQSDTDDK